MKTVTNLVVFASLLCQPLLILAAQQSAQPTFNYATILQDTRNEPKVDGTFGFLYRTEDGISHGAKGDADGAVHGRFTYTDPTGLKVNFNYNAGSRAISGYTDNQQEPVNPPQPAYKQAQPVYKQAVPQPTQQVYRDPEPQYEPQPQYDSYDYQDDKYYQDVQPQPQAQAQPQPQPQYYQQASYSTELQYGGAQPAQQQVAQPRYDAQSDNFGHSTDYTQAYFPRTKPPALRARENQQYYQNDNSY